MFSDSSKLNEQTFEISFIMWLMPIEKVIEWTNAKFLNNPRLVFSNPISIKIEPN